MRLEVELHHHLLFAATTESSTTLQDADDVGDSGGLAWSGTRFRSDKSGTRILSDSHGKRGIALGLGGGDPPLTARKYWGGQGGGTLPVLDLALASP